MNARITDKDKKIAKVKLIKLAEINDNYTINTNIYINTN